MRTAFAAIAVGSLLGAIVFVPLIIGALVSLILVGAFLLALVGVFSGLEDRTVRQHEPSMDPRGWRNGG
jgi:uncharacterized membrane protein